jgi:hypothetical protein
MPASSIGSFTFVQMSTQPVSAGQQLQPETKAGVDGVGFWKLGSKGTEYQVQTLVDVADYSTAVALAASYKAAQNAGALAIVYGGVSLGNVLVLSVEGDAQAIARGFGGTAGTSLAVVRATWRLIAV